MELYLFTEFLTPLCARVLKFDIEVEHVRRLVQRYRLQPPHSAVEKWPWRLQIHTLGRFAVSKAQGASSSSARFQRLASAMGQTLEEAGDWAGATGLYERALDNAPLAEPLNRKLMTIYLEKQEAAQALTVYRRCRDVLATVLGAAPGTATEALAARAYRSPLRPRA